jgi:hypothetical protein
MAVYVCRCCGDEIPPDWRHVEILVSLERPRPGMHASGRMAAAACEPCAQGVADGILRAAALWTPAHPCPHRTVTLEELLRGPG